MMRLLLCLFEILSSTAVPTFVRPRAAHEGTHYRMAEDCRNGLPHKGSAVIARPFLGDEAVWGIMP